MVGGFDYRGMLQRTPPRFAVKPGRHGFRHWVRKLTRGLGKGFVGFVGALGSLGRGWFGRGGKGKRRKSR